MEKPKDYVNVSDLLEGIRSIGIIDTREAGPVDATDGYCVDLSKLLALIEKLSHSRHVINGATAMAQHDATMTEQEEAVAMALFDVDSMVNSFRIAWEDIGDYRRFCYKLRAQAAIEAIAKPKTE